MDPNNQLVESLDEPADQKAKFHFPVATEELQKRQNDVQVQELRAINKWIGSLQKVKEEDISARAPSREQVPSSEVLSQTVFSVAIQNQETSLMMTSDGNDTATTPKDVLLAVEQQERVAVDGISDVTIMSVLSPQKLDCSTNNPTIEFGSLGNSRGSNPLPRLSER